MTDPNQVASTRLPLPAPIPFIESLGAQLIEMADGKAVAVMTPAPHHMNSWDVVHGGVLMTLLDFVMAMAGRSARRPASAAPASPSASPEQDEGRNLTVEMKTSFMRPARGRLTITGRCVQSGRSLSFCEAEITDAEGAVLARASGTFKFWSAR
jgi:uncharacterized protein (TIGR00369 family)